MHLFFFVLVKLRNLNMNDNIVVESCILKLSLRDAPAHHVFSEQSRYHRIQNMHKFSEL